MILVDTSIWVSLFSKKPKISLTESGLVQILTTPPVIQEVLQGIHNDLAHRKLKEQLFAFPSAGENISLELYLEAGEIYRLGRTKGFTIRSSIDCLIAAIAMRADVPIWHLDRDFEQIAKFTALKTDRRITL